MVDGEGLSKLECARNDGVEDYVDSSVLSECIDVMKQQSGTCKAQVVSEFGRSDRIKYPLCLTVRGGG